MPDSCGATFPTELLRRFPVTDCAFSWESLLTHVPRNAAMCRGILGVGIMTTGSGPIRETDFDDMLKSCGVAVWALTDSNLGVLVVGHDDWESDDLDEVVRAHAGESLRVYSQEMVLTSLMLGADVFEVCSVEELAAFADGHPALEYLAGEMDFAWPTTDVVSDSSDQLLVDFVDGEWPETGVLKNLGYRVGHNGLPELDRQATLDKTFQIELVAGSIGADGYIDQWGKPRSQDRLQKIANCLATFAKTKKRTRHGDYAEAISNWESDLAYLERTYYHRSMGFHWPDTDIQQH